MGWLIALLAAGAVAGFAPAAQAAITVAVSVTSSVNPSTVGQRVTFTVTAVSQPRGQTLPQGFGSIRVDYGSSTSPDQVNTSIPFTSSGDTATGTYTMPFSGVGTHSVVGDWESNDFSSAGTSPTLIQTVNTAPTDATTTSLTVNPAAVVFGTDLTALATVTDTVQPGMVPTGDVTFESDGASIGDGYLDPAGHASMDLSSLAVGAHSIVAVYAGQAATDSATGWLSSTSAPARATISAVPDPTSTSLSSTQNPVRSGQALTLVAQVTDDNTSSAVPPGKVAFVDNGGSIASVPVNNLGFARATVRLHGRGDHLVLAEYQPAGAWLSSESEEFDVLVLAPSKVSTPRACTSRVRTLPLHIVRGAHVSWVAYMVDGRELASSRRGPTFTVKIPVSELRGGRHTVTAVLHYISKGRNHPVKSLTGHFRVC